MRSANSRLQPADGIRHNKCMVARTKDLWSMVWGGPQLDPKDLAQAVARQVQDTSLDYRTRLLIRDSMDALRDYWGPERWADWFSSTPARERLAGISRENFERVGFPSIRERLMDKTDPEVVKQMFRELGTRIHKRLRLSVGDSIALILPGLLTRATTDIDVVDELPMEIRSQHALLDELRKRYGLILGHFQSHYLPSGWNNRAHYLDTFGELTVYLVDVYDIFLSKLISIRTKDLDDLRMLLPQLDKNTLVERIQTTMAAQFAADEMRQRAVKNWYILYGEDLPA